MLLPPIRFAAISITDSTNPNYLSVPRVPPDEDHPNDGWKEAVKHKAR
jgi:hypothetical protein